MKNKLKMRSVYLSEDIFHIMSETADSFYDQSVNNESKIEVLSRKFAANANFICAEVNDSTAGFAAFYSNDTVNHIGYLSMIIVKSEFQGWGIGTELMDACIDSCRKDGMKKLRLEVNPENFRAISMYKKIGFEPIFQKERSYIFEKSIEV